MALLMIIYSLSMIYKLSHAMSKYVQALILKVKCVEKSLNAFFMRQLAQSESK